MKYKVLLIVCFCVVLLVAAGTYISSRGKVYIDLANVADTTDITLTVLGKRDDATIKTIRNKTSVTLKSGTHTVSLRTPANSIVKTVSVPPFFGTTTVSDSLVNEQQRTFVGTNPSPCMLYIANVFYSASCGDDVSALQQQVPPTLSSPGYTDKAPTDNLTGTVLSTGATNASSYMLLETFIDEGPLRTLLQLGPNLSVINRIELPAITEDEPSMATSGDRVLVYFKADRIGYLYTEATGSIEKITLPDEDSGYEMIDVSLSKDRIVTTYLESEPGDSVDEAAMATGSSKIFVQEFGKKSVEYSVPKLYSTVSYCDTEKLCALDTDGLDIYSITSGGLKELASLPGLTEMFSFGDTVRYIDSTGIQSFDTKTLTGYYDYTFGKYTSCGVGTSVGGYLACVIDSKNQKHALFISATNKAGTDEVDKKVLEILKNSAVSGFAATNNFIYVIPNYGDVGIFTQDTETTARVNDSIDFVIQKSSISKQQYFVINAGNPL